MMNCNRCQTTGFLNLHQLDAVQMDIARDADNFHEYIITTHCDDEDLDVCVCDCCGDGEDWHGKPGEHYSDDDPQGPAGPYASGVAPCH